MLVVLNPLAMASVDDVVVAGSLQMATCNRFMSFVDWSNSTSDGWCQSFFLLPDTLKSSFHNPKDDAL